MLTCASAAARVVIVLAGLTGRILVIAVIANAFVVEIAAGFGLRTVAVKCAGRLDALVISVEVVANVTNTVAVVAGAAVAGRASPASAAARTVNVRRLDVVIQGASVSA